MGRFFSSIHSGLFVLFSLCTIREMVLITACLVTLMWAGEKEREKAVGDVVPISLSLFLFLALFLCVF